MTDKPNIVNFTLSVQDSEKLIMPLPDLIMALGRTQLKPVPCEQCGLTILFGTWCLSCVTIDACVKQKQSS